jgi:hypothetical protein
LHRPGKTVKPSLRIFGMRGHTTMSNLVMALAFFVQGTSSKYFSQYACLALWSARGAACGPRVLQQATVHGRA